METERTGAPTQTQTGMTREQVAERAGLDPSFVVQLCELGMLHAAAVDAFNEGDVRRARIVHSLAASGIPLEALAEALRRGEVELGFIDDPAYRLFTGLTDSTFGQLSEETGIPLELLVAIREAMGSAQPGPEDGLRVMELEVVPAVKLQLEQGVRPAVIERSLRAYGENLRRMSEVEADWWMSDVIQPIFAAGGTMADVGPRTAAFANTYAPLSDRMVLGLFHGHQANSWMKNIFEGFEAGLARAGLLSTATRLPAICFLDLSGYTRLTDEHGDAAAADLAGRLSRLVQRTSARHGGKPVKWLGDGVMFFFPDPGRGVVAAIEMVEGTKEGGLPPAHVGLHTGPVLFQEGDYYGRTVNVASRIADYARQGEVLVSDEVVAASASTDGVTFDPIGPVELKGLTEAVSLHVARRTA
jgi:adenylate cyclase